MGVGTGWAPWVLSFQNVFTRLFSPLRLLARREWSSYVNFWMRKFGGARGNWQSWMFGICFGVVFSCNNNLKESNGYKEIVFCKPALSKLHTFLSYLEPVWWDQIRSSREGYR